MTPEAVARVRAQAELGEPEALCLSAVFAGLGAGETQNWSTARARLSQAAAHSDVARRQLAVLDAWPLATWLAPTARERLSAAPRISMARDLLPVTACDWLIARAQGRVKRALVFDAAAAGAKLDTQRSNSAWELELADLDLVVLLARARIAATLGVPAGALEPVQILHYAPGQQFARHHDYLDPAQPGHAADIARRGQRMATALVYLNTGYEGGQTDFPVAGLRFRGEPGDALLFANIDPDGQPEPRSLHAGLPTTRGEKWLLSQWVRDRAPA